MEAHNEHGLVKAAQAAQKDFHLYMRGLRRQSWLKTAGVLAVAAYVGFSIVTTFKIFGSLASVALASAENSEMPKGSVGIEYVAKTTATLDRVAIVPLTGVITEQDRGGSSMVQDVVAMLEAARRDPRVKAVVLEVRSPGGEVNGSDLIWHEVMKIKHVKKPVVAHFNGMAASGGYYAAAPANAIFATPATITGSIGVIGTFPNFSGLMEKVGVQMVVVKSGKAKDAMSPFKPVDPGDQAYMQRMINKTFDRFVWVVSTGRKMDERRVRAIADGGVFLAEDAMKLGLVDRIGYLDHAIHDAARRAGMDSFSVVRYKAKRSPFGALLSELNSRIFSDASLETKRVKFQYLHMD